MTKLIRDEPSKAEVLDFFAEQQLKIKDLRAGKFELIEYREATLQLFDVAMHNTSGGHAAAQVLLSVMNGGAYHMNLNDLNSLDANNFVAAISVMWWRQFLRISPSDFLTGAQVERLDEMWKSLLIENRY